MGRFLVVRADDHVVFGVSSSGCAESGGVLTAVDADATLVLTFPPQALSETKVEGASIQGGLLGHSSRVTLRLPAGATVPLDVPGLIEAVAELDVVADDATAIELPAGLIQRPTVVARGSGPAVPVVESGVSALWELVVVAAGGQPLQLVADQVRHEDEGSDVHPLDARDRDLLKERAGPARADRLRLSALGGTLTSHLDAADLRWDHVTALGRDQRVRWEQPGILYPFGHPAVLTTTVVRRVADGTASLHRETVLRVVDPVRLLAPAGSLAGRVFPFSEAELLTTTLTGIDHQNPVDTFTRPVDVSDAIAVRRQTVADTELPAAIEQFGVTFQQPIPQDVVALDGSVWDHPDAAAIRELQRLNAVDAEEKERFRAEVTDADGFISASDFATIQAMEARILERDAQITAVRNGPVLTSYFAFLAQIVPSAAELAQPPLYVQRMAGLGNADAQHVLDLQAELAHLDVLLGPTATPTTVSAVLGPPGGGSYGVRCAGALGDVMLHVPLFFLHDVRIPADGFFGGYSSLDDPGVLSKVPTVTADLPGVPVDLVRRPDGSLTTDVQEVHALALGAELSGRTLSPLLRSFTIELPEIRALLPGAPTTVTARLDGRYLEGGPIRDVIRFDQALTIDFDQNAERGGGLLTPTFAVDAISDDAGPVDRRMLPGGGDPMAALASMRVLGIPLRTLLRGVPGPPAILQLAAPDGVPRGVELAWPQNPDDALALKTAGPFVAHVEEGIDAPDTTTLSVRVTQGMQSRHVQCVLTGFTLRLPTPQTEVLRLTFTGLTFREESGHAPTLDVSGFDLSFRGSLRIVKDLQEKASAALGGAKPQIELHDDGVTATFSLEIGDASAGAFVMRNIAAQLRVHIPFRGGSPAVRVGFATREAPFQLSIPPFGGGGYLAIGVEGDRLSELDLSMEFGGMIEVDFKVLRAEVHALGGVRAVLVGSGVTLAGFLRLGGSVSILGLASVSIEMRVELIYDSDRNQLAGRATLVLELDLTLYADSVELDSGLWVFAGGSDPPPPPSLGSPAAQQGWAQYQGAYA